MFTLRKLDSSMRCNRNGPYFSSTIQDALRKNISHVSLLTEAESTGMTSLKKPKPPPLVLSNPNAQYWPVLSPLAEFAAIATSPESPLVKKMSCDYESSSSVFKV